MADTALSWEITHTVPEVPVRSIATDGAGTWMWAGGSTNNAIYRSVDGGLTWSHVFALMDFGDFNAISTDGAGVWVAIFNESTLFRSSDNGESWVEVGVYTSLRSIATDRAGTWVATQSDNAIVSYDNGLSWSGSYVGVTEGLYDIAVGSDGVWVATGGTITLARSANNGVSWSPVHLALGGVNATGIATDGQGRWAVGSHLSIDNGLMWDSAETQPGGTLQRIATDGSGNYIGCYYGYSELSISRDHGVTWTGDTSHIFGPNSATCIATDGKGLWMAGSQGGQIAVLSLGGNPATCTQFWTNELLTRQVCKA